MTCDIVTKVGMGQIEIILLVAATSMGIYSSRKTLSLLRPDFSKPLNLKLLTIFFANDKNTHSNNQF